MRIHAIRTMPWAMDWCGKGRCDHVSEAPVPAAPSIPDPVEGLPVRWRRSRGGDVERAGASLPRLPFCRRRWPAYLGGMSLECGNGPIAHSRGLACRRLHLPESNPASRAYPSRGPIRVRADLGVGRLTAAIPPASAMALSAGLRRLGGGRRRNGFGFLRCRAGGRPISGVVRSACRGRGAGLPGRRNSGARHGAACRAYLIRPAGPPHERKVKEGGPVTIPLALIFSR